MQVFDFERWATHRSSQRYFLHLVGIPKVLVLALAAVSTLLCFATTLVSSSNPCAAVYAH